MLTTHIKVRGFDALLWFLVTTFAHVDPWRLSLPSGDPRGRPGLSYWLPASAPAEPLLGSEQVVRSSLLLSPSLSPAPCLSEARETKKLPMARDPVKHSGFFPK